MKGKHCAGCTIAQPESHITISSPPSALVRSSHKCWGRHSPGKAPHSVCLVHQQVHITIRTPFCHSSILWEKCWSQNMKGKHCTGCTIVQPESHITIGSPPPALVRSSNKCWGRHSPGKNPHSTHYLSRVSNDPCPRKRWKKTPSFTKCASFVCALSHPP